MYTVLLNYNIMLSHYLRYSQNILNKFNLFSLKIHAKFCSHKSTCEVHSHSQPLAIKFFGNDTFSLRSLVKIYELYEK